MAFFEADVVFLAASLIRGRRLRSQPENQGVSRRARLMHAEMVKTRALIYLFE